MSDHLSTQGWELRSPSPAVPTAELCEVLGIRHNLLPELCLCPVVQPCRWGSSWFQETVTWSCAGPKSRGCRR